MSQQEKDYRAPEEETNRVDAEAELSEDDLDHVAGGWDPGDGDW